MSVTCTVCDFNFDAIAASSSMVHLACVHIVGLEGYCFHVAGQERPS